MSVNIFNVKSYKFVLFLRILITGGLPEGGLKEISGADKDFMEDYTPWLWFVRNLVNSLCGGCWGEGRVGWIIK